MNIRILSLMIHAAYESGDTAEKNITSVSRLCNFLSAMIVILLFKYARLSKYVTREGNIYRCRILYKEVLELYTFYIE